ncbi:MAG: SDR family NAD(P)-dependent oxidoreductase [Herbiconiux sp.]|nr:SDR family NAD(P)-dependent oxidoreductase [Herbiconiux sp.]
MGLKDQVAIITGAASGQGAATTKRFVAEGARVAMLDWDNDRGQALADELIADGHDVRFYQVDISDESAVNSVVESVVTDFGQLDVLFNNAGIGYSSNDKWTMADLSNTPADHWKRILDINLNGVFYVTKAALPHLRTRERSSIVINASINALVGMTGADAYTASKGALVALTRVWAVDYGRDGVRVNCLCPGSIDTPMMGPALLDPAAREHFSDNLLGRMGTPDDIASLALFLASNESGYITGTIIPIDGGWTAR